MTLRTDWGPEFWQRHYVDEKTRVVSPGDLEAEGLWLVMTLHFRIDLPVHRILDIGSGTGAFAHGMEAIGQGVTVERIDPHGPDPKALRVRATEWPLTKYDLIVCRDTLHYLGDHDAARVLDKMNASGALALYLRVSVFEDASPDPRSDEQLVRRPFSNLTRALTNYVPLRFGIWLRKGTPIRLGYAE